MKSEPKPYVAGYTPAYPTETETGYCDGCSIALHADDLHEVEYLAYKLQCADDSNFICVFVIAQCLQKIRH